MFIPSLDWAVQLQQRIRRFAAEDLGRGTVGYFPPRFTVEDGVLYWDLGWVNFWADDPAVHDQYEVEMIRKERSAPHQRAFWDPYLQRIEQVILDALVYRSVVDVPEMELVKSFDARTQAIKQEAMRAYAASIGAEERCRQMAPSLAFHHVILENPNGQNIGLLPYVKYRLAEIYNEDLQSIRFFTYASGSKASLVGNYMYRIEDAIGVRSNPQLIAIDHDGRVFT